ncbi:4,5-dihydroxyphthalate dehydrogenase [Paenibacillus sp. J31TS4]|uniref:Gfo/Idh/MocA family protein n=1 Tax=Paenibacillus sp. J31TS4 TaxID=2807195 RepID=UPI001B0BD778|nr:Gfo/Idh/MocA family oxidoreductase [Paenibacillus sp. J31TS4]GIP37124.1 4,5-dihydroxyphthalate dehydrogenase [Paenibacillus sp. J31TS4]
MKRYVLVGAGARARGMFARPFAEELTGRVQLVGVYDANRIRSRLLNDDYGPFPVYEGFGQMLQQAAPDAVIVASSDDTHHDFIVQALEAGCDVVSEKPMTIDSDKCKAIREAEARTGRRVTVTFNLRFVPYLARVRQLLMENVIGQVQHVSLDWRLDRRHGADYFRRWHARMERSGGLLVHKATHHFDLINWWLDSRPETVQAFGRLAFYGPNREVREERCLTCSHRTSCELYYDLHGDADNRRLYLEAEREDGYIRDRCVFGEHIDIYDTMTVHVRYDNGTLLDYSLVAYSPDEGWKATLTGTHGRMEIGEVYSGPLAQSDVQNILITLTSGEQIVHRVPSVRHGHGGGDERLRRMIFLGDLPDPLGQQAGSEAGAYSLLIGAAANLSIAGGGPVSISDLL